MTKELQGGNGRAPQTVPEPADKKPAVTAAMVKGCPHFALLNDPDTSLLFPSSMGYCHHAQPPAPVRLNHQEAFCLTARHTACPVFQQRGSGPLPAEILGRQEPVARPARLLPRVAGGVALLAIVALL
ncbi:MAG: hypothetical protein KC425_02420, partial [Anaerolineales bacterium]|nr:hypothetical protein [Anaerolineales bacterium]